MSRKWNRGAFLASVAVNVGLSFSTSVPHPDLFVRLLSGLLAGLIVGYISGWIFAEPQP